MTATGSIPVGDTTNHEDRTVMTKDEILADMRGLFGRKTMLSPADIAEVISQSEGAQAAARCRGRFDIPLRKRGRKLYVSLHDLVDWLYTQDEGSEPKPTAEAPTKTGHTTQGNLTAGKPRRASLASALVFAQRAHQFDTEVLVALEAVLLEAEAKKADRRTKRKP